MLKNVFIFLFLLTSISAEAVILDGKTSQAISSYHRTNPNAAFMNKIGGMIGSYNQATSIACEEVAYKYLKDTFLIYQTDEYYNCMKKSYLEMLAELEIDATAVEALLKEAGSELRIQNKYLSNAVMNYVDQNLEELSKEYGAHCPTGYVRFGSYRGTGKEATDAFCKYNTLSLIAGVFYEKADLERLGCGAFFSTCEGYQILDEEIEYLVKDEVK